jgi:hypothetical protein
MSNLSVSQFGDYLLSHELDSDINRVTATHKGARIGSLSWDNDPGARLSVGVEKGHQRKGVATEMLRLAKESSLTHGVHPPTHSEIRSDAGDAWTKSEKVQKVGVPIPPEPKKWVNGYPA